MDEVPHIDPHSVRAQPDFSNDSLAAYLQEISSVPLLQADEEIQLGKRVYRAKAALERLQCGNLPPRKEAILWRMVLEGRQAACKMTEANLRLVVSVAKRYAHSGLPFVDLVQEGNLGLLKAVSRYDHRLHYRFSTYATYWIRQAIGRSVAEHGNIVRLPAHMAEYVHSLRKVLSRLQQTLGRDPTIDELALEMGILSEDERQRIVALRRDQEPLPPKLQKRWSKARECVCTTLRNMLDPVSLETPVGDEDGVLLEEVLESGQSRSPADEVMAGILKESLSATLSILTPREKVVVRHRFGLEGVEEKTLEELGVLLGITRERVRQIEQRALGKLRAVSRAQNLVSYLS